MAQIQIKNIRNSKFHDAKKTRVGFLGFLLVEDPHNDNRRGIEIGGIDVQKEGLRESRKWLVELTNPHPLSKRVLRSS